jgi:hypothetical protein
LLAAGTPVSTTNRLYRSGSTLYWNGSDLSSGFTLPYSGTHTGTGMGFTVVADHATGRAGQFQIDNGSNAVTALYATSNGSGNAFLGKNTGTGRGAYIQIDNASSSTEALAVTTNGTGDALIVDHTGSSGDIAVFQSGGSNKVRFNKDGDGIFAGGIATSGRINAPNHNNDQGLNLPANDGVPSAVTGTAEGDIVWDYTNDDLYVYNGSSFSEIGGGGTPSGWTDSGTKVYVSTATDWVGIGTTNPPDLFVVNGGDVSGHMRFQDNTTGATLTDGLWVGFNSTHAYVSNYEDSDVRFGTNNIIRMTVENDGDVGIGTNDPLANLHIVGSATLGQVMIGPDDDSDDDSELFLAEDNDGTFGMRLTYDGGDNRLYINGHGASSATGPYVGIDRSTGRVGIAIGTNSPDAELHVGGQVKITGGTPGSGKVLVSDASGLATWEDPFIDNLNDAKTGGYSYFLGEEAGDADDGTNRQNIGIGYRSLVSNTDGDHNISIGHQAMFLVDGGQKNVGVGRLVLGSLTSGSYNTVVGFNAGYSVTGSGNVMLGHEAGTDETGSDKLYIENSNSSTPLIGGDFAADEVYLNADVGIGTSSPNATLDVNGTTILGSNGTAITAILSATASLDFPNAVAGGSSDLTITVTGANVGDAVVLGVPNASMGDRSNFFAWVSSLDTVTVRFTNHSSSSWNPPSGTFRAVVIRI